MKLQFVLLFFLLSARIYSQYEFRPGYIVKHDGKTEEGLINFHGSEFNAKKCEFKKDANAEPVVYLPNDIEAYRFTDSKYFVSKKISIDGVETDVFLECLISGKATVYYITWNSIDYYYLETNGKLVEMNNNQVTMIKNGNNYQTTSNQYKGILKFGFKDCPEVLQEIDRASFTKKSMIKLSKEYHEYVCKDEQCIIYEKKYPKKRISWGFDFSFGTTKLEFSQNFGDISMKSTIRYQFGVNSQIKIDEEGAYNLQVSLGYFSYKNELLNNTTLLSYVSTPNDVYYKFSVLKPAIQLRYKIKAGKIIPFASAGVFSSVFLTDKGELYSHNFQLTVPFTSGGLGIDRKQGSMNGMLGGIGEIGFETKLKSGNLSFSFFYEPFLTNPMKSSYNLGLRCGYSFYL